MTTPPTAPSTGSHEHAATTSTGEPEAAPVRPRRRNPHLDGNWRSLVLSMLAVGAVVLVLFSVVPRPSAVVQPSVDVTPVARQIREETGRTVSIPALAQPWRAGSVRHETTEQGVDTWYAGYNRTDDDRVFVAVRQMLTEPAAKARQAWLDDATARGSQDGTVEVAGTTWTRYTNGADPTRRALVGKVGGLTTVVSGLAEYDTLAQVAGALRPFQG